MFTSVWFSPLVLHFSTFIIKGAGWGKAILLKDALDGLGTSGIGPSTLELRAEHPSHYNLPSPFLQTILLE